MGEKDLKFLKTEFPDEWKYLNKKLAYPYEYFNSLDDYQNSVENSKKEDFFSKLKNKCPVIKKFKEQKKLQRDSILKMEKN